jgi:hypothetical protein
MKTQITFPLLLFSLILFSTITLAQITFTADDLAAAYAVGNVISNYSDSTIKSVDIGSPGGGNNWNFQGMKALNPLSTISVLPSSIPYTAVDFPGSNIVLSTKRNTSPLTDLFQYATFQPTGYFTNGSLSLSVNNAGDTAMSKEVYNPGLTQLSFPVSYNVQWESNYTLGTWSYINGTWSLANATNHSNTIIVDAYGSIVMPDGGVLQALRLKRVSINYHSDGSFNTSISYLLQTKGGFSVTIAVSDTNAPDNGIIQTFSISWNRINPINVSIPATNEIVLAGKTYNSISWFAPGITDPLRIDFSTDGGNTFNTIASNVTASPGNYGWNVPDILCTKAMIKIVDINDTTKYGTSGLFKIKGYVLTRIDNNGNYEKFEQGKHGWRFINTNSMWPNFWWSQFNYQTGIDPNTNNPYPRFFHWSLPSSFPDWPLWVKVFSPAQCYVGTGGVYKGKAEWKWQVKTNTPFNGSCFGFAASSFMAFSFQSQFLATNPGIPAFTNLYDLLINDAIRSTINGDFLLQYGKQSLDNDLISNSKDPRTTLQELKDMFMGDNPDIKTISIFNNNGNGGGAHTMAPVKLVQSLPGVYLLYLYNSNHPGDTTGFIKIDSTANKWTDNTGLGSTWNGNTHFYLEIPVSNYFNTPIFNKISAGTIQKSTSTGNIEFYNTPDANVIYTASNGSRIGVTDSSVINEIGNGIPIFNKSGNPSNPIGFYIPDDSYSMGLNNAHDATGKVYLTAFKNDVIYSYERDSSNSTQTDRFKIDNGFSVISPDQANKLVNLGVIAESDTLERIMFVNNTQLTKNDSLYLQQVNQSNFVIKNYGSDKTYDLELNNRSALGQTVFQYPSVILKANSTHTIVPDWGNLNLSKLKILIDNGNKGTNDDSVVLVNQYTGFNDNNKQTNIPNSYSLAQNYPNPFNPTTTINYQLKLSGQVTLKVYDILGREVATLVNEEKPAGTYSVIFDAGKLSSGIYFFRLKAGNFVETKKMILLK